MTEREFLDAAFAGELGDVSAAIASNRGLLQIQSDGSFYEKGTSALHLASAAGHEDIVDFLISRGANVNISSQDGSPLMMAVWSGHAQIVDRLISAGADVNYQTSAGVTALHQTALKNSAEIARMLMQFGSHIDVATTNGATDMYSGSPDVQGETPLHIAARHGSLDVLRLLLENGADSAVTDRNGKTPFQWAEQYEQDEAKALLA